MGLGDFLENKDSNVRVLPALDKPVAFLEKNGLLIAVIVLALAAVALIIPKKAGKKGGKRLVLDAA